MATLKNIKNVTGFTSYNYNVESTIEGTINIIYTNLDLLVSAIKRNGKSGDIVTITSPDLPQWKGKTINL